jgi:ABC-type hemin transport system ATPase subunit
LYDGHDVAHRKERDLARCRAVLSQAVEVAFSLPVRELVLLGRYPHFTARPGASDLHVCEEVMRFFDVAEMADRSYGTLSGGEKQRVQFARVLAQIWRPIEGATRLLFSRRTTDFPRYSSPDRFHEEGTSLRPAKGCCRGRRATRPESCRSVLPIACSCSTAAASSPMA